MKIFCAQINQVWEDIDSAFEKADEAVSSANADMVVFCEQFATGWRPAPSKFSGEEVKERWISLARKYKTCVVGSYQKKTDCRKPENTMLVCAPDGSVLAEYSKIHLFSPAGEDKNFSAGAKPVTFEFGGIKFGCAICFDLRFPEIFREYLHAGCQAVLVQAAWAAARVA
ncbi:MAG: nitrilase-related carbon-nitrogen hydrolase, partial [Methanocorpusculum sp.]|nr:nitrilase-related carbon-nitrogen hydrolase [Methanocorpusculum sp.]